MLISLSWLKKFVDFSVSPEQLAADLTLAGLEAEGLAHLWKLPDRVVAAIVESVTEHPSLSHLKVCAVHAGDAGDFQVVCGASNCVVGMMTVLALPGAFINGHEISVVEIGGVRSDGMLCSMAEICAGDDESGIANINDAGVGPGASLANVTGFGDWILELGITPNRPDCLSIAGVAREVSAIYGLEYAMPSVSLQSVDGNCPVPVRIDAHELCRRYAGAVIEGVTVGPSPAWLKNRLVACGIRSVNNIVDITNYVMLELGQPMHAFDLAALQGPEIIVRTAGSDLKIRTLDGRDRELDSGMLTICDASGPVAIAGVMGGHESQVTEGTASIFLESACFTPSQVRRMAKRLKLPSESSFRFERGVDPELAPAALDRAVALVLELAGGVFKGGTDVVSVPFEPVSITFLPERANRMLGTDISSDDMKSLLNSVGIEVQGNSHNGQLQCVAPSWRLDIHEFVDLVEEVARLHGFDEIPVRMPVAGIAGREDDPLIYWSSRSRDIMASLGMSEIISYSFLSERAVVALGFPDDDRRVSPVRLMNPLSEDQAVMRTTLLPSILEAVSRNIARRNLDLKFFETGTVFLDNGVEKLPDEEQRIAGVLTGRRHADSWAWPDETVDFYDLKGLVEGVCGAFGMNGHCSFRIPDTPEPWLVPDCALELVMDDGISVGIFGRVSDNVLSAFDIEQQVYAFEFSMERLAGHATEMRVFVPLNRYPAIELDLAVVVDRSVKADEILSFIHGNATDFMESCSIFDVYQGKPISDGSRSIGLRFMYRSPERTLSEEDVAEAHDNLVNMVLARFNASLRS